MESIFEGAAVIVSYTRTQAIADGALVDVTTSALGAGFRLPVAMSAAAYAEAVAWDEDNECPQDVSGRLWDVLFMGRLALRRAVSALDLTGPAPEPCIPFKVLAVPNQPKASRPKPVELVLHIGPGDAGEPVTTIMLPHED